MPAVPEARVVREKGGGTHPLRGTVAAVVAALAAVPMADAVEAYTCSVGDAYNQHCTLLRTADFDFPWTMFTIFIFFFAVVVSGTTCLLMRWWQRRRVIPVESLQEEEDAIVCTAPS